MTLPLSKLINSRSEGIHIAVRRQLFFESSDVAASSAVICGECISTLSSGAAVTGAVVGTVTNVGSRV